MIKYVAILFTIFILVQSQRPPYAGSYKPYPAVLPQYIEEQAAQAAAAAAATSPGTIVNRIGPNDGSNDGAMPLGFTATSSTTKSSTIPPDLPVDALGDIDLINRIKTWPREKQPFWFLNWKQIQEHRGDTKNRGQPVETQPNTRSFFAG